ncbi:Hypothetical predicted protein [Mytilus galloprovincialis]|uniref:Farnesoic acid O-methyl transferase domain-containing protein n=1 Tax=Mytilus galloprovincialis TaxID=29158 RepID=A0A8B6CD29_MYTGA|nr:Hypothetical predicted protein [Mytilus galloprovincialis]
MFTRIHNRIIGSFIIIQMKFVLIRGANFHIRFSTPNAGYLDAKLTTRNILDYVVNLQNYGITYVDEMSSLKLEIKSCKDGVVFLSSSELMDSAEPFYEIVFGAYTNTRTYILKRNNDSLLPSSMNEVFPGGQPTHENNTLNCSEFRSFWVSWSGGHIKIGRGPTVGENMFVEWEDPSPTNVRSIGMCTWWGNTGQWKIYVEDLYSGYYNGCGENNTRADLNILQSLISRKSICSALCSFMDDCIGFNYQYVTKRCELLSLESAILPVDGVSLSTKSFWRFYTKCFRNKAMCVGCF